MGLFIKIQNFSFLQPVYLIIHYQDNSKLYFMLPIIFLCFVFMILNFLIKNFLAQSLFSALGLSISLINVKFYRNIECKSWGLILCFIRLPLKEILCVLVFFSLFCFWLISGFSLLTFYFLPIMFEWIRLGEYENWIIM